MLTSDARIWRDVGPRALRAEVDDALFIDANHGWIVTSDCAAGRGRLLRTSDGGEAWSSQRFWNASCAAGAQITLDFLNPRVGWAVHAEPTAPFETLSVTHDGGVTWRAVNGSLPWTGPVAFRTAPDGWLGGLPPYRTRDGGPRWHRVRLPVPRGHGSPEVPDAAFAPPAFHESRALLAAGFRRGGRLLVWVYSTSDQGRTWALTSKLSGGASSAVW